MDGNGTAQGGLDYQTSTTHREYTMGGFFGTISLQDCTADLFYGTDYNSHLGTRRGGMAGYNSETNAFTRSIHNLESSYFRTKFEPTLGKFQGCRAGIGVISDTDAQPLIINSHLGRFAIVTVAKIQNLDELATQLLHEGRMDCIFLGGMLAMSSTTIIYKAFDDMRLRTQKFASNQVKQKP